MINIRISGQNFDGLGEEVLDSLKPWAENQVRFGAELIASNARQLLSREGTGRQAKRFLKTRRKTRESVLELASAPGAPPAFHRGKLRKAIYATKPKWKRMTVSAAAGPRSRYAAIAYILEFGGRVGRNLATYIAPRPFMRPAEKKARPVIDDRIAEA